ncbi:MULTISPECIES: class Ib ribonucleoside-diphosphate reductase assembly flavoprotein NrdI [Enterococcus]|uniref:NrdI protein n=1 Tax=Candidatus Enterococcus mangumiae TaxID=2230878 RepID=A0ABZ2ST83_9ENTE|nr:MULTISPECIES: class Ib ribonucleoside-diphosphate reductase assembly flavoprotein NrdI [unclassified Enterococcus]MBO0462496.1 class Ib ribonucleoside-diphosphate reductase assembly flavoprotein NrdI [Enterococcus sp. DIV1298c]MBO0488971.1 class Ib ribonucleoside-diphosphate reductase assembly flavoprotein NrdI [Enterococcus sp. DIV1094]MBO1301050.1 class Ib ribonucleoside-diphosphate reductase assembly flavoprotein NrdI [Enterococcus sp. DIV1271a]
MNILYISISGNTRGFVKKLAAFAAEQHDIDASLPLVDLKEIHENSDFEKETEPFFTFVPTYLEGGNGIDSGDQEILTETMREYLEYQENHTLCLGVIGSGNKNFNHQYCLTAKQYAEQFGFPMVEDYELRGTPTDVERIYRALVDRYKA